VKAAGQGNYYPEGRTSWYPAPGGTVDQYVTYDLTFRVPKDVKVVATGNKVSEKTAGDQTISIWHTKEPIAVAGFNMGRFRESEVRTPDKSLLVQAYANEELPDYLESLKLRSSFLATLNSTSMMNTALNEGNAAFQVYQDYFGPLEYDHVALTQQVACTYGQSWPMLVYLPVCYFFDATTRHVLGLDASDRTYWDNLVAHETAHQWWGQTVGFNSYRDQWMSEGFADWSASLYLKSTRKSMGDYHQFWKEQQKRVTEKNANGLRPNDVGPLSMGTRVSSSRAGEDVYEQLIYSKGAYIPHMLELMFFTNAEGSEQFKKTMRDFVSTYKNRAATTEDFKAIVEKHMPRTMDLDHNGKLDWFFNEWVYGTALPHYVVESNVITEGGSNQLHFKVTQSGVTDSFKMLVPLYLEMKDGKILRVATVSLTGNSFVEKTVSLPPTMQAKRALLNAYEDVLTD
jgi:aminopeptidase N